MHFPYPPARWWDNPYCPCGNILFFTGESKVEEWCARHGRPKGAALDMRKAIALADRWFGDYASPDQGVALLRWKYWEVSVVFRHRQVGRRWRRNAVGA